jgi:hypothetical protein
VPELFGDSSLGEGSMSERASGGGTIESLAQLIRELKFGGLPAVAWTVIVCTALLKQDGATLRWLWPELFRVWAILVGGWAAVTASTAVWAFFRERRRLVPVVVQRPVRVEPGANDPPVAVNE